MLYPSTIRFNHQPFLSGISSHRLPFYSPGYPDTERFKLLNSVSIHSRSCQEDEEKICTAIGILSGQRLIIVMRVQNADPKYLWCPTVVNCFSPEVKSR